jgi:hypothetical protein
VRTVNINNDSIKAAVEIGTATEQEGKSTVGRVFAGIGSADARAGFSNVMSL